MLKLATLSTIFLKLIESLSPNISKVPTNELNKFFNSSSFIVTISSSSVTHKFEGITTVNCKSDFSSKSKNTPEIIYFNTVDLNEISIKVDESSDVGSVNN